MLKIAQLREIKIEKGYLGGMEGMQQKTGKTRRVVRILLQSSTRLVSSDTSGERIGERKLKGGTGVGEMNHR